jgi:hypothetical protein
MSRWISIILHRKEIDMRKNPWYEKYSFIVFTLIALMGVTMAIQMMVAPGTAMSYLADFDHPIPGVLLNDPDGRKFFLVLIQWIGATLLGCDFLTLVIALTAWRKGDRWAWFAFLYWPFLFIFHYSLYRPGPHKILPLVMLTLAVVTLASNARRMLGSTQPREQQVTAKPQTQ